MALKTDIWPRERIFGRVYYASHFNQITESKTDPILCSHNHSKMLCPHGEHLVPTRPTKGNHNANSELGKKSDQIETTKIYHKWRRKKQGWI